MGEKKIKGKKCRFCDQHISDEELVEYDGYYFHLNCKSKFLDRRSLQKTIVRIFNQVSVGPAQHALIKRWVENDGLTYKGIEKTLIYYFEIKGHPKLKTGTKIGIVPSVYEEARRYFSALNEERNRIQKNIITNEYKTIEVVAEKEPEERKPYQKIEFSNPFDMSDEE